MLPPLSVFEHYCRWRGEECITHNVLHYQGWLNLFHYDIVVLRRL